MPADPQPDCPRCGYDQSGAVAAWTDRCPLEGVCAECGYTMRWRDVLNAAYSTLPGYVEHANTLNGYRRAFTPTLGRVLLVLPYWSRVRPHHAVRLVRLALFVAVVVAAGRLVLAAVRTLIEYNNIRVGIQPWGPQWSGSDTEALLRGFLEGAFLEPWPAVAAESYAGTSFWGQFYRALTEPYAWAALPLWLIVSWPLTMLLLPQTLSASRVRRAHVARAALLAAAPLGLASMFSIGLSLASLVRITRDTFNGAQVNNFYWYTPEFAPYLLVLYGFWICLWWLAALRVGWRIEGAGLAWALLLLVQLMIWPFFAGGLYCLLCAYAWR